MPDNQPNPALVSPGLADLREEAYNDSINATPGLGADLVPQIPAPNESQDQSNLSSIPEQASQGNPSGQDLLRRLSLVELPAIDPRTQHPGLKLSGRLISAAFCLPYKLYHEEGSDWV